MTTRAKLYLFISVCLFPITVPLFLVGFIVGSVYGALRNGARLATKGK